MSLAHRNLGETDSAVADLEEALRISERIGFRQGVLGCSQKLAFIQTEHGDVNEALLNLSRAEQIAKELGDDEEMARTLSLKGAALETAGRYEEAIGPYFQSIEIRKRIGSGALSNSYQNLGSLFVQMGRTGEAKAIYSSLLGLARESGDSTKLAATYLNLSAVAAGEGRNSAVVAFVDSSLAIRRAIGNVRGVADCFQNRATAFMDQGLIGKAQADLDSAMVRYAAAKDEEGVAEVNLSMALLDLKQGQAARALAHCDQGLALAHTMDLRGLRAKLLSSKADALRALGRFVEAVAALNAYVALKDSILGEKATKQLANAEMREKYDAVERIAQIKTLEGEKQQEQNIRVRRTLERNGLIALAVLLIGLSILLYRNIRNRRKLAEQERQIFERRINELMHENEVKALNALLQGQEAERQRIAKDLHDRLGSLLSAVKHQFGALESRIEALQAKQSEQYGKVYALLDDAVEEVRRISHDMIKGGLAEFGLAKALQDLRDSISVKGRLEVELNLFGLEDRMERSTEITVYRMVQELVSNALKHGHPSEMTIALTRSADRLNIIVSDNGEGFMPGGPGGGIGLGNVRSRAEELGGTMSIDSAPKHGTTVSIDVPLA
jgi:signal transduction histidine kinase